MKKGTHQLLKRSAPILVDIDGTLTIEKEGWGYDAYKNRTPNTKAINMVNHLKKTGYEIILWTSRFSEDAAITQIWLDHHGVQYDKIIYDKPFYVAFLDDKAYSSVEEFYESIFGFGSVLGEE